MITQVEKQYKHKNAAESTGLATKTALSGFTEEDIAELMGGMEEVSEVPAPIATTDNPRLVTRGPHPPQHVAPPPPNSRFTIIDTLSFTAREPYWVMQELLELSCPGLLFIKLKAGFNGYHSGFLGIKNKVEVCKIFYGSKSNERQNQKCQVLIGGNGKSQMIDWPVFSHYANFMDSPTVKNIHIAYDVFDGSLTIEGVNEAHSQFRFKNSKSYKNPLITPYGQIQPDGYNPGRTVYIGSKSSNKFIRFYEKAYEMFKDFLTSEEVMMQEVREMTAKSIANGDTYIDPLINKGQEFVLNQWVRAEIEFSDTNCIIPLDILLNHDDYFSEAYPYTKDLLAVAEGKLVPRLKPKHELDFLIRVKNIQRIAGSTIDDMIVLGWSNDDIVEALKGGKGASQKLIRSGAYQED